MYYSMKVASVFEIYLREKKNEQFKNQPPLDKMQRCSENYFLYVTFEKILSIIPWTIILFGLFWATVKTFRIPIEIRPYLF